MDQVAFVNGIHLHYLDHPGGDPPILLMPGLTHNAYSFAGLIEAGLSPRFRVLALTLRGRGLSDKPAEGYSMADHAADVLGLLDELEFDQAVLGGHSFGGVLAYYMAARHPERVSKVVAIDAAGSFHPDMRELIKPSVDRLGRVLPSWEIYLEAMKQMPFLDGWWHPAVEKFCRADVEIREDGSVKPRASANAIIEAVDQAVGEDWAQHLASIRQPVLLLNAPGPYGPPGTPPIFSKEQAMETVNAVADGRYVEIPGNHATMVYGESAIRVVEAIAAFLED
jgi:pimeloyl-ACP methyl ester carboxylesterase